MAVDVTMAIHNHLRTDQLHHTNKALHRSTKTYRQTDSPLLQLQILSTHHNNSSHQINPNSQPGHNFLLLHHNTKHSHSSKQTSNKRSRPCNKCSRCNNRCKMDGLCLPFRRCPVEHSSTQHSLVVATRVAIIRVEVTRVEIIKVRTMAGNGTSKTSRVEAEVVTMVAMVSPKRRRGIDIR